MSQSDKRVAVPRKYPMTKMWSIIVDIKKDFRILPTYQALIRAGFNIKVTEVKTGKNKYKYGIRIYNRKKEPNERLVRKFLDFIFD